MTIRDDATHLGGVGIGLRMAGHLDIGQTVLDLSINIIRQLEGSREVTEKVTTVRDCAECAARDAAATWACPKHALMPREGFVVTAHKARVVLDD